MIDLCLSNLHLILSFKLFSVFFFFVSLLARNGERLHQNNFSRCNVKTIHVIRHLMPMKHVACETCDWFKTEAWSYLFLVFAYCTFGRVGCKRSSCIVVRVTSSLAYFSSRFIPIRIHKHTHTISAANEQGIENIYYQYAWYVWIVNNGKTEWTDLCLIQCFEFFNHLAAGATTKKSIKEEIIVLRILSKRTNRTDQRKRVRIYSNSFALKKKGNEITNENKHQKVSQSIFCIKIQIYLCFETTNRAM